MQFLLKPPSFPLEVEWNLTWRCNVKCFFCSTGLLTENEDVRYVEVAYQIVQARPLFVTLSGGEPLTHPAFTDIVALFNRTGVPVNLTTNGTMMLSHQLSEEAIRLLNWVRVSVHTVNDSLARRMMGTSYSLTSVLYNIRKMTSLTDRISCFVLLTRFNCDRKGIMALLSELAFCGVRQVAFGFVRPLGRANNNCGIPLHVIPDIVDFLQEARVHTEVKIDLPKATKSINTCPTSRSSVAITPSGNVMGCIFNPQSYRGNIMNTNLLKLWQAQQKMYQLNNKHSMQSVCFLERGAIHA